MLRRQDGFRLFLDDDRVDVDSNLNASESSPGFAGGYLLENAIRSAVMNHRNALLQATTKADAIGPDRHMQNERR